MGKETWNYKYIPGKDKEKQNGDSGKRNLMTTDVKFTTDFL